MLPLMFLAATLCITIGSWLAYWLLRQRSTAELRRLAVQWNAHYAPTDRFDILPHVLERFPIPGAAGMVILDVLYAQDRDRYRYLFTVEFTLGVILEKRRLRRVGLLSEARESRGGEGWSPLQLAPDSLPWLQQYEMLHSQLTAAATDLTSPP